MVWALLIIPIAVGLFLEYTVSKSTLSQKVTWRNLLTFIAFFLITFPLIVVLLFLPQPWQDYAFSGLFIVVSVIFWILIGTEPRRKRRAGSLLWNLGRLSSHRLMLIASVAFVINAILQTSVFFTLAREGFPESHSNPEYYISQIIFYWSIAVYFFWAGLSRLQLRENGIYYKFGLIKWKQIASYKWEGEKGNTLTVWLKRRFPFFAFRSWPIPLQHKATIERLLAQYLAANG